MNIIEKRKKQLKLFAGIVLFLATACAIVGLALLITCKPASGLSVAKLVVGIILMVLALFGFGFGIFFMCMANSVQATKGSIAEENLGHGTVNMHKCSNCGAEVKKGEDICAKCKENLK